MANIQQPHTGTSRETSHCHSVDKPPRTATRMCGHSYRNHFKSKQTASITDNKNQCTVTSKRQRDQPAKEQPKDGHDVTATNIMMRPLGEQYHMLF